MRYRIGLDIGITSVGWAVVEDNEKGEPVGIVDLGVRIFEAAEVPKTGASLAEERCRKRSGRRRNRRKVHRILRIKKLLIESNIITKDELELLYLKNSYNIYEIRTRALDFEISNLELSALLINFVKRRGYKSNAKCKNLNSDNGKVLKAISENNKLLKKGNYRTVGEMYFKDDKFKYRLENGEFITDSNNEKILKIRNTIGNYNSTVERECVLDEINQVFSSQKRYNKNITDQFIKKYIDIFSSQRNFDDGPAFPSKYAGNVIKKMIGNCTFEKNEMRAPKSTYTFEIFKLLQDLNRIKVEKVNFLRNKNGVLYYKKSGIRGLTESEKIKLIEEFKSTSELLYTRIREIIKLPFDYIFNMINYHFINISGEDEIENVIYENERDENVKLKELEAFHTLRKTLDSYEKDYIFTLNEDILDYIATILTWYKSDEKRIEYLSKIGLDIEVIKLLLKISFSKFSHLSIKAMKNIIPYLKEGMTYDKAANMVYDDFRGNINCNKKKKLSLNDLEKITNPVVRRGISQSIKVLNAIVRKYGSPEIVNIELAREFFKSNKEIEELKKVSENNVEKILFEIKSIIKKENIADEDIIKYRLWKDQKGKCMYSGEDINLNELFTDSIEVDYIIPYSKSLDDSYSNKVLTKSIEVKKKREKLAIEHIIKSGRNVEDYRRRVALLCKNKRKINNLLKENFTEEDETRCKERNLKDTQYITKIVLSLIKNHLYIEPNDNISESQRVIALRGGITYNIRKFLNIEKIRENDRHHAIDAVIIAIANDKIIQKITNTSNKARLEQNLNNYMPYDRIYLELKNIDKRSIFVSKMPNRKVKGQAHKETINGISKNGNIIVRKRLTDLKLDKNNEIEGYYNKNDDRLLYEALKKRLILANGDAKIAFSEPFFKPRSNGEKGPIVNKVKLELKSSSNVRIDKVGGVAGNGDTVRIDMFYIKGEGYYFIPIYVSDTIKKELPNRACISNKPQSEWKKMKDDDFIFSLYPGDLVYVKSNRGFNLNPMKKISKDEKMFVNEFYGYYIKCGINSSSIALSSHDRMYWQPSLGIRRLSIIKKYQVDVLGNYTEVRLPEKRMCFNLKK